MHTYQAESLEDLKQRLSPEEYKTTQEAWTEPAFTGKYWNVYDDGAYYCVVCGTKLFDSTAKFDSGCGWPSFDAPVNNDVVETRRDDSFGMVRDEVVCRKCGAHLGHVFNDGPKETTGLRFCINSSALRLQAEKDVSDNLKKKAEYKNS